MSKRNKTQPRIEAFVRDLSNLCRKHGMIVDANGGGKSGAGIDRGPVRFNEGCPLVLYTESGQDYRKVGYLWYRFTDKEEEILFNFEPKPGTPYHSYETEDEEIKEFQPQPVKAELTPIEAKKKLVLEEGSDGFLNKLIQKSKEWEQQHP